MTTATAPAFNTNSLLEFVLTFLRNGPFFGAKRKVGYNCIVRSRPLQLLASSSAFTAGSRCDSKNLPQNNCGRIDLSLRKNFGEEQKSDIADSRHRSHRHLSPCGGHRGWVSRLEVSLVYAFGRFRLNKGFNGHHVGSCSPSILMRDPFVFSKSAHGTSDVTSTKVKVHEPPV